MIVKMDLHTHTKFSDGRNTVIDNIRSAEACGLEILGITDHVFRAEDFIWLDDLRNIIRKTNSSVKVLAGAEVHIKKDGTLPLSSDSLSKLDIVIGESYVPKEWNSSLTRMKFLEIVGESIKKLAENKFIDIIAHPLHLGRTRWIRDFRDLDKDFLEDITSALANSHVAVEVMSQMYWWYPDMRISDFTKAYIGFIKLCSKKGCRFSVGSDAHSAGAVGNIIWSLKVLEKAGVTEEDLIKINI